MSRIMEKDMIYMVINDTSNHKSNLRLLFRPKLPLLYVFHYLLYIRFPTPSNYNIRILRQIVRFLVTYPPLENL